MSMYSNFIKDFPSRCCEVMEQTDWAAMNREMTVSLMTASAAFLIPFERMRPLRANQLRPPTSEREPYPDAKKHLSTLLDEGFATSHLYKGSDDSWRYCPQSWLMGEVDTWARTTRRMPEDKTVRQVLTIIRNGLAHGNVEVRGEDTIEQLVFASQNREQVTRGTKCTLRLKVMNF